VPWSRPSCITGRSRACRTGLARDFNKLTPECAAAIAMTC
jgi:hypothetical protein